MNCSRMRNDTQADSLQTYLKEIRDEQLLTAAEECRLAEAIAQGDTDARSRMIQANLRLVVKIARDYIGRGMILEDLVGEGNLGLIRAAKEFQPRFGTRFSTYAAYWIKQSIRHALINTTSTIRLPAHMVGLLTKWRRTERVLARELGRMPNFNEVAVRLNLTETQKYLLAKALQARQLKLESSIAFGNDWRSAIGSNDHDDSPHALLEKGDECELLRARLACLDDRERMVLVLRYGLEGETPLTLKEIGRRLGVTREWVRKIEVRAVRRLYTSEECKPSARRKRSAQSRGQIPRSSEEFAGAPEAAPAGAKLRRRAASRSFKRSSRAAVPVTASAF
jgi:RNA polymerase primary sigma factor